MPNYSQEWSGLDASLYKLKTKQITRDATPKPPPPPRPPMKTSNAAAFTIATTLLLILATSCFSLMLSNPSKESKATITRLQTRVARLEAHTQQQSERIRTLERAMIAQPKPPVHRHLHKLLQRKSKETAR